jgi:hypothetical protein
MTMQDPRQGVSESIENAIAELSIALVELDRMPVQDRAAIGWIAHALTITCPSPKRRSI